MKKQLKTFLNRWLENFGFEINRRRQIDVVDTEVVSLKPKTQAVGNVLMGFIIEPFLRPPGEPISTAHTHDWESVQMAQTFLDMGYCVDVISYRNECFVPEKKYDIFVAARTNFERIAKLVNTDCIKIVHQDTAHWVHNNHAAYARLLELKRRRGLVLNSIRLIEQNWAMEYADYVTVLGNEFTIETYKYAKKPIYRIPISSPTYPWLEVRDIDTCRHRFLWFGSSGFVHKGLDLVLEAFAAMPEFHLTVCGPIDRDCRFKEAYHQELYKTPNIHTEGWVDTEGRRFLDIAGSCIGVVYPSCAEGGGGAAITCMHAGLIPILSYEASVDVADFGVILRQSSVEEITAEVRRVAEMSAGECRKRSRQAWEYARRYHTRETFAVGYKAVIRKIINGVG